MVLVETCFALAMCGVLLAFAAPPLYAGWKKYCKTFDDKEGKS